jgi:methyltransferase-like protein
MTLYAGRALGTLPPLYVSAVSARPAASPLAHWQAKRGALLTNRRHEEVTLKDFARRLLGLLDGSHTQSALAEAVAERIQQDMLAMFENGKPVRVKELMPSLVQRALSELAARTLWVA